MQIYGSAVLHPLISFVSESRERGQFWQEFATNRNYQDFLLILGTFQDNHDNHDNHDLWQSWGSTMIKLTKKIQEIELAGEDKSIKVSMIIHAYF